MARPRSLKCFLRVQLALAEPHYRPRSIAILRRELNAFEVWCRERGVRALRDVDRDLVEGHVLDLLHRGKRVREQVWALRWLGRKMAIIRLDNPAEHLRAPRVKPAPRAGLTAEQVETLLDGIDVSSMVGLRTRTLLEVAYSTGLRRAELIALRVDDVDIVRGVLLVRGGKCGKDRGVPVGARALQWVERWLRGGREDCVHDNDQGTLFMSQVGRPMSTALVSQSFQRAARDAGVPSASSPHAWRHAAATHLLEGGADLRHVQAFLGHADVQTTVGYTHVDLGGLKAAHRACHPFSAVPLNLPPR